MLPQLLALVLLLGMASAMQPAGAGPANGPRPKIGLALSGGGARGAAHIGILRVLEETRVPIDFIAGTSMGAIVGGLYASGMTPDQIEAALKGMDWEHIFSDSPPRKERTFRRKRDDDLYLVKQKPGLTDEGELRFPTGAIQGQKFDLALRELTLPVAALTDFDRLYIPFRAIAADIGNGKAVVLKSGDLATAMRASMAVPGAFAATEIDHRLLVDGGIVDNLPIDVVRQMGADIVIAVDISTPYMPAEQVTDVLKITWQLTSMLTRRNVEEQIATLRGRDLLIVPDLGDFDSGDFAHAEKVIAPGRAAAEAKREQLARLGLSESAWRAHLAGRGPRLSPEVPVVQFVRVENDSRVADAVIRERLHQEVGSPLDRAQLEKDIGSIYGLELFQTVRYDLVEESGNTGLVVSAHAREWGPNYLQSGVQLSSDVEGQNAYNLGLAYLRTGINPMNGEVRVGLQVGEEPAIAGEWHQPLDPLSSYFIHSGLRYGAQNVALFDGRERLAEFRVNEGLVELALGREFSTYGEGRLGYRHRNGEVELSTGTPGWSEFDYTSGEVYGRLWFDRLDNFDFPETGWMGLLEYASAREALGSDSSFDQMELSGSNFTSLGDGQVLGLSGSLFTTLNGDAPIQDRYRFGGLLRLSGYPQDALSGQQAAVLSAMYYRRYKALPFLSWYVGASIEYGGVWEETKDLMSDAIPAGSLFLGADTPIGPAYLGYGLAEGGNRAVFFYLGRPLFR